MCFNVFYLIPIKTKRGERYHGLGEFVFVGHFLNGRRIALVQISKLILIV